MKSRTLCQRFETILALRPPNRTTCLRETSNSLKHLRSSSRTIATSTTRPIRNRVIDSNRDDGDNERVRGEKELDSFGADGILAAPEIDFANFKPNSEVEGAVETKLDQRALEAKVLRPLRFIPASAAYFTARPRSTDDYLQLAALRRKYQLLPTVKPGEQPKTVWRDFDAYQRGIGEPIKRTRYKEMVNNLRRMNMIHPLVMPEEVRMTLKTWERPIQPSSNKAAPIEIDEFGRAEAIGKRKASSAKAWVVEGDGQVLINGLPIHKVFARLHDRESVLWSLKVTNRMDKYNVFGIARGGGTTGQAEALTLAVSKALIAHEPDLKSYLRLAGTVTRDPRRVERKKHGHRKARKMPTWVKR